MKRLQLIAILISVILAAPSSAQVPAEPGEWPQWRGPNADGVSTETGLLREWPADGPVVLWQVDSVGVGYSSLAVSGGRIFTLGDLNGIEHILCLDAKDGSVIWQRQPGALEQQLTEKVDSEFQRMDRNLDGDVSLREFPGTAAMFQKLDQDADGLISAQEAAAGEQSK